MFSANYVSRSNFGCFSHLSYACTYSEIRFQHSIIIIIIILVITFMQGIYNYIPATNHVSKVYNVADVMCLHFVLLVMLFRPLNKFFAFTLARTVVCVRCPIWLFFCSSLISFFLGMLLGYCLVSLLLSHSTCVIIIIIIIEFFTSQFWLGNIPLSWDVVINRIRLGGLICSLKSFLQLSMCQELQIFAVVYMYWGAS